MEKLTDNAKRLYHIGLRSIQSMQRDNAAERRKLLAACRDVDKLNGLWADNHEMFEATISTTYPSPAWTQLLKIDKQITRLTLRLLVNSRQYGWTPMARSIIRRRFLACHTEVDEADPLEALLSENDRRMCQPDLDDDPMEEVLSSHEPVTNPQKTDISIDAVHASG